MGPPARQAEKKPGRKAQRQAQAARRQSLKPFSDRVRDIEKRLAARRMELEMLERKLADGALYTDPSRKEELTGLIREQAGLKSDLEALELEWLEASEALERAENN